MNIGQFLESVIKTHATGQATEHSYRPALQGLLDSVDPEIYATNEPKRTACGAPDFILERKGVAVGHLEAKDLGVDLRPKKGVNAEQRRRYRQGLPNLLYTNCHDWDLYRQGELVASVSIAEMDGGILPRQDQFALLENLLRTFTSQRPLTITRPATLAAMMAGKAALIKEMLNNSLAADVEQRTELAGQYRAIREHLLHDLSMEDFADLYAETITYGMFAARLHDPTLDTFSRQEAMELLPRSNPFLRNLFSYIAGPSLDEAIRWIIDDLADVFRAADVRALMDGFGELTGRNDPFLHFYEEFLRAYNPKKRKARGVWYTPEPVVSFIVRSVDEVLRCEFGLEDGLADTSRVPVDWDTGQTDRRGRRVKVRKEVHRVQILDPATGTGTFPAEVIKQIAPRVKGLAGGMWSSYVERDLIPRLHGFELLMASYAMCHMKLDMILTELEYKPSGTPPRLSVFLTNSLEEGEPANQQLPFAQWLSNEAKEANAIKRDIPIMAVIGNPPYSGISQNMGPWITGLIEDYKYVDGVHFREKKHWLQDDYVKFIRLAEKMVEENGEGVVALITNHGYLDNPTFRGMRWHLLQTFDRIWVMDLHGSTKKKETAPDGSRDDNVFDIQQGVAIMVAVKRGDASEEAAPARVLHTELWGPRASKYATLWEARLSDEAWAPVDARRPLYLFKPRDYARQETYERGFSLKDFFPARVSGIVTSRDHFVVDFDREPLAARVAQFCNADLDPLEFARRHKLKDNYQWKCQEQRQLSPPFDPDLIRPITYRPFDDRWIYYQKNLVFRMRQKVMRHMVGHENLALVFNRTVEQKRPFCDVFVFKEMIQHHSLSLKEVNYIAPLYLYPDASELDQARRTNLDDELFARLRDAAAHPERGSPDEVAALDYVYGVLHCPAYRQTYEAFLKSDFPRIPWPGTPADFWDISDKGGQLRRHHLMESAVAGDAPCPFDGEGDGMVEKVRYRGGRVFINSSQYFADIPEVAWSGRIGGYKPAQKWLQDRKGRCLTWQEVRHYQKIVKVLCETDRISRTITMELD